MTGGRLNRFNIVKQSKDYDRDGDYVRHWIPELKDVPTNLIHEPWKMSKDQQSQYGVRLGCEYPHPIVEPFTPKPYDKNRKNGKGGKNQNQRNNRNGGGRGGKRNPKLGKGQERDMKSLKQGNYRVVGEWTM